MSGHRHSIGLPDIRHTDSFKDAIRKLSIYFNQAIEIPSTFEQLRTTSAGDSLRVLVDHLCSKCTNPAIVNALLALKWHYDTDSEQHGLGQSRSSACEIVAWRFLNRLSTCEVLEYCLYEIPESEGVVSAPTVSGSDSYDQEAGESSPLLSRGGTFGNGSSNGLRPAGSKLTRAQLLSSLPRLVGFGNDDDDEDDDSSLDDDDPAAPFKGLNALEIAAVADAKRFLSQNVVQRIITGIWNGTIVFWDSLTVTSTKKPRFYNPRGSDPFCRLRVPKYMKFWELVFFSVFLCLFYAVLINRQKNTFSGTEIALLIWFLSFFLLELNELYDAGSVFYSTNIWNFFDVVMVLIGFAFVILRFAGIAKNDSNLSGWAFDILSLEALFLIPRIFSILSLSPYLGTMIPCLKEMGKDFIKFALLVIVLYLGFLTTFSLLARDVYKLPEMVLILTKIFFGSSYIGFDIMDDIDPVFGLPLMVVFIILTNFLLLGALTGILSNSFMRVTNHAREEYFYVTSVYVLEASTSNRLAHFYPPFNLLALMVFWPWSLFNPKSRYIRSARITLLKITHLPIVAVIQLYELLRRRSFEQAFNSFKGAGKSKRRKGVARTGQSMAGPAQTTTSWKPSTQTGEDDTNEQSAVESQIIELHRKLDALTAAVMALQEGQG